MQALSASELAGIVGGLVHGDPAVMIGPEVVIDSRRASAGALFVALPGGRADGHLFIGPAVAAGAVAALVRAEAIDSLGPELAGVTLIAVPEVVSALGALGRWCVDLALPHGLQVVGITGSMGKTTTKDLLHTILAGQAGTVSPENSYNNEIGVPLTATRLEVGTRYLISEMGARGVHHIELLCGLTPPRVGVVLNVGHAHVAEFGSQDQIAVAKGELIAALPADGVAVLNADDPRVRAMADRGPAPVLLFADGQPPQARAGERVWGRVWATDVRADAWGRHTFTLSSDVDAVHTQHEVRLAVPGRHQVINAVAAAAAAMALGIAPEQVASALDGAGLDSHWRMELTELEDGTVIVNDAFNANPDSVRAALLTVSEMARNHDRRVGVVLADMLELGARAADDHRAIGAMLPELGVAWAVLVGDLAAEFATGARAAGLASEAIGLVAQTAEAIPVVHSRIQAGDIVLIKGSRGMALETVAAAVIEGATS